MGINPLSSHLVRVRGSFRPRWLLSLPEREQVLNEPLHLILLESDITRGIINLHFYLHEDYF
jgi:hypothetical protein